MPNTKTKGRSCGGKNQYPTKQAAEDAMQKVVEQSGAWPDGLTTYRCSFGSHWHFGHVGRRRGRDRK